MKHIDEIYRGARLALRLGSMEKVLALRLESMEKVIDYLEIVKLNDISANAWVRGNNSGSNEYNDKMKKRADKAYLKALKIADMHGFKIDCSGGLYWEIKDGLGKIE